MTLKYEKGAKFLRPCALMELTRAMGRGTFRRGKEVRALLNQEGKGSPYHRADHQMVHFSLAYRLRFDGAVAQLL